jgi:hypothetical protein
MSFVAFIPFGHQSSNSVSTHYRASPHAARVISPREQRVIRVTIIPPADQTDVCLLQASFGANALQAYPGCRLPADGLVVGTGVEPVTARL